MSASWQRWLTAAAVLFGCEPDLGDCETELAFEIVYTEDGVPAFAGQALINQSCGGGGFCHSPDIAAADRYGVPQGLDFDLRLASTTDAVRNAETARLSRSQVQVHDWRHGVWGAVETGTMPPADVGDEVLDSIGVRYDRVADDGVTFEPLPGLDTPDGRRILRSWLACGSPVVERTVPRADVAAPVGFVVPSCRRRCLDPTWPSLHESLLVPSCATGACHDDSEPAAALDLTGPPAEVRQRLVDATAEGAACTSTDFATMPMITPGDPEASLLWLKVAPLGPSERCGAAMPLSGAALGEQALCALREWIATGACGDPTDETCVEALAGARERCGVILGEDGVTECAMPQTCPNQFDPERG